MEGEWLCITCYLHDDCCVLARPLLRQCGMCYFSCSDIDGYLLLFVDYGGGSNEPFSFNEDDDCGCQIICRLFIL